MMSYLIRHSGIVRFEVLQDIGILTIDNGKQNKIDQAEFVKLDQLKSWLTSQPLIGLIITGEGRNFSSGANVDYIKDAKNDMTVLKEDLERGRALLNFIESLPILTVAAIGGICFGAGLEIALSCHYRIASQNALIGFPESNLGIMPGLSGTIRLPRLIGRRRAIELIVSGRSVSADEGYDLGIIDQVVPKKTHVQAGVDYIHMLTENKTIEQINCIVSSIHGGWLKDSAQAMAKECDHFLNLVMTSLGSEEI